MAMSKNMATTKTVLSTVGSAAAAAMVARSIVNEFLPHEIRSFLLSSMQSIFNGRFSSETTMIIDEFDGLESNQIFEAAQLYIGTRTKNSSSTSASAKRLKVKKPESEKAIQVGVERNEEIVEEFEGVKLRWVLQCHRVETKNFYNPGDINSTLRSETRCFHLTFHKKHKDMVLAKYLPHILEAADFLKQEMKSTKLFTVDGNNMYRGPEAGWSSVNLNHPATFETLAMDSQQKKMIIDDLNRFSGRKEYYRRVGKAWKRGYLLYGPPGTGKSSLVAAMANYLNFDIYDMELSSLRSDSDLRKLLIGTANRSILAVEDIDCSIDLKDQESESVGVRLPVGFQHQQQKVTLSGLLNFIDGLWSSCGDERIIIFTTNHKEKLDPALLRPGRMDVHIHMSYCTFGGFNILARNYLGVQDHKLFKEIEILIEAAEVSPAEVAEQLMKHDKPDPALESLLNFLKLKKIENAEVKAKESEVETQSKPNKGSKVDEPQKIEKPEDMIKKLEVKSQPEANNEGQVEEPAKDVEGQNGDSLS